jgi:hypothetical protein
MGENNTKKEEVSRQSLLLTKRIAAAGIFIAVGVFLSAINPFGYFFILESCLVLFFHVLQLWE